MKVVNIVGARPNFVKVAPVVRAMKKFENNFESLIVHTGQHYDVNMSDSFFQELEIPEPDVNLGVGSGSHAKQTARIMVAFEKYLNEVNPHLVIVYGDVNSTIACALVAVKMGIPVAHVESGLRSFDKTMPEEINRILTDAISDQLFTTEAGAKKNLSREGVPDEKIHFVGNVMIDSLIRALKKIDDMPLPFNGLKEKDYALITLHRPSNVDKPIVIERILDAFVNMSKEIKLVFSIHPRTEKNIKTFALTDKLTELSKNGIVTPPISYLKMLRLMKSAKFVITDSGGMQEETTFLRVPCITMRNNTERPITVDVGSNVIIGNNIELLYANFQKILSCEFKKSSTPPLWDGKAAERIVEILCKQFC